MAMHMLQIDEKVSRIAQILARDAGGRGLLSGPVSAPVSELTASLAEAKRVLLLTGFPVRLPDGRTVGETDGPSGTANIAKAMEDSGAGVRVLTDAVCIRQVKAAAEARGCRTKPVTVPGEGQEAFFDGLLASFDPTHLITLERPGKARDGCFYNMRGGVIDHMVTDTGSLLKQALRRGVRTISVGDGGNELGMGALRTLIEERVPYGELICADEAADIALVSGVSNWWGWGIAAALSLIHGRDFLPSRKRKNRCCVQLLPPAAQTAALLGRKRP